jgi:hypothetical protein
MNIMQDPIMQNILQQAQGDPAALQEHMKNPGIRAKVTNINGKIWVSPTDFTARLDSEARSCGSHPSRQIDDMKASKRGDKIGQWCLLT